MRIDHVTIAGQSLRQLDARFAAYGFGVVYGGVHSTGLTHMSIVALEDGSYVELISTVAPGPKGSPWWREQIAGGAGPCGWSIQVDDVAAECERVAALGVEVRGPVEMYRERPDGVRAEWDFAQLGPGEPGSSLPFMLHDTTPREHRVPPSAESGAAAVTGVEHVVLGVENVENAVALFRLVYGWAEPVATIDARLGLHLARFEEGPVILAAPVGDGALAERLRRFGPGPCGFVCAVRDLEAARERFGLGRGERWLDLSVSWLDDERHLGLVAPRHLHQADSRG